MWTARKRPTTMTLPEPNHFTLLVPRSWATGIEQYAGTCDNNPPKLDVAGAAAADASTADVEPSTDAVETQHVTVDEPGQPCAADLDVITVVVEPQHIDVQDIDKAAVQQNTCTRRRRRRKRKRATSNTVGKRQRQVIIIVYVVCVCVCACVSVCASVTL